MKVVRRNSLFPAFFDDAFLRDRSYSREHGSVPATNVKESDDAFTLEMVAPGFRKQDFNVHVENNVLTISGKQEESTKEEENRYTFREFHVRNFKRAFSLPEGKVDRDAIAATYEGGVLNVTLPKLEEAKPKSKLIEVA